MKITKRHKEIGAFCAFSGFRLCLLCTFPFYKRIVSSREAPVDTILTGTSK